MLHICYFTYQLVFYPVVFFLIFSNAAFYCVGFSYPQGKGIAVVCPSF